MLNRILTVFLLMLPAYVQASGTLTAYPSYYFSAKAWDVSRWGLYVQEKVTDKVDYSSWSGSGRAFSTPPNPSLLWLSTAQDLMYNFNERFQMGGGLGLSYTDQTHFTDADIHMRLSVKLW